MSEFAKAAELLSGQDITALTDSDFDCLQRCAARLRESGLVPRISERIIRRHRRIGASDIEHALNAVGLLAVGPDRSADIANQIGADDDGKNKVNVAEVAAIIFQQAALISPAL